MPYLFALDDDDYVFVFLPGSIDINNFESFEPSITIHNQHNDYYHHHPNSKGTWSGDVNPKYHQLALGSNSWRITFFDIK